MFLTLSQSTSYLESLHLEIQSPQIGLTKYESVNTVKLAGIQWHKQTQYSKSKCHQWPYKGRALSNGFCRLPARRLANSWYGLCLLNILFYSQTSHANDCMCLGETETETERQKAERQGQT